MTCQRCGAVNDPSALACAYCNAPTAAAHYAKEQREQQARAHAQWAAATQAQNVHAARLRLESAARQALGWSIGSFVICCLPLGVVGIVQGFRARSIAASLQAPAPTKATVGIVLGFVGSLMSIAMVTWLIIDSAQKEQDAEVRIAELDKRTAKAASETILSHDTACALAEAYALRTGFDSHPGYSLHRFECVGKLVPGADVADLDVFRFRWGSSASYETHVCFKHGAKWYVDRVQQAVCSP